MKLVDLIAEYHAPGFVLADFGNGSSSGCKGQFVDLTPELLAQYGSTPMMQLPAPHMSADGVECNWESEIIVQGEGQNPYRVKLYF